MDNNLENIQNGINESVGRLNQYRQDEENDLFRYFSIFLIGEVIDIISEFK